MSNVQAATATAAATHSNNRSKTHSVYGKSLTRIAGGVMLLLTILWYNSNKKPGDSDNDIGFTNTEIVYKEVDMRQFPDLKEVSVTFPIKGGITVLMPRRKISQAARLCPKLPTEILEDLNRPDPVWYMSKQTNGGVKQFYVLKQEMIYYLEEKDKDKEEITLILYLQPGTSPCT